MTRAGPRLMTCLAVLCLWTACGGAEEEAAAVACDRDCLIQLTDRYLLALVAGNPSLVPLAEQVKFVEQSVPLEIGQGLWETATDLPQEFRIYVPDPVSGQVGFLGVMEEFRDTDTDAAEQNEQQAGPAWVEIGLRLKVENGRITEAEHLIARNLGEASLANLEFPRPVFQETVPAEERMDREEMLRIGGTYYEALVQGDGSITPFAEDCVRRENGMQTTGNPAPPEPGPASTGALGCAAQLDSQAMSYIKRIEPRRVEIADPVQGLVFGLSQFRHPMEERTVEIVGVPGVEQIEWDFEPFDLTAAHVFVVRGGQMHEIEAMGYALPYDSPTGWER